MRPEDTEKVMEKRIRENSKGVTEEERERRKKYNSVEVNIREETGKLLTGK